MWYRLQYKYKLTVRRYLNEYCILQGSFCLLWTLPDEPKEKVEGLKEEYIAVRQVYTSY